MLPSARMLVAMRIHTCRLRPVSVGAPGVRMAQDLPAAAIIQNTVIEIASAPIRDWRMY